MPKTKLAALALLVLGLPAGALRADVLLLDGIEMAAATASMRPKSGMSMAAVESAYGQPEARHAAVGEPPITRWDYAGFSVYFEHDRVVHAVARP